MARRTRKQKEAAKHSFTLTWEPGKNPSKNVAVKSQSLQKTLGSASKTTKTESAKKSEKDQSNPTLRLEIVRTLLIAGFILALELVLYLANLNG